MIIRSLGKVHSFKVSPHFVLIASIFLLLYICTSIFVINRYFDLRQINVIESEKITQLEREVFKSKKIIYRSEQHVALLEDHIRNLGKPPVENQKPQEQTPPKAKNLQDRSAARDVRPLRKDRVEEKKPVYAGSPSKDRVEEEKPVYVGPSSKDSVEEKKPIKKLVNVVDVAIEKEGSRLIIDFKLVKAQSGQNAVGGYIHIIAMRENAEPPLEWTFPQEKLENGFPINFRHGQRFNIQKFKPIHGEFYLVPNSLPPTAIQVLAYDRAGNLIMEKAFEVENGS
jgi:hypothetical protein